MMNRSSVVVPRRTLGTIYNLSVQTSLAGGMAGGEETNGEGYNLRLAKNARLGCGGDSLGRCAVQTEWKRDSDMIYHRQVKQKNGKTNRIRSV